MVMYSCVKTQINCCFSGNGGDYWSLKISDVNNGILVFKFGVIKSVKALSCLFIDICTVTCGRQVGIGTVTRYYLCTVARIASFCIKLS